MLRESEHGNWGKYQSGQKHGNHCLENNAIFWRLNIQPGQGLQTVSQLNMDWCSLVFFSSPSVFWKIIIKLNHQQLFIYHLNFICNIVTLPIDSDSIQKKKKILRFTLISNTLNHVGNIQAYFIKLALSGKTFSSFVLFSEIWQIFCSEQCCLASFCCPAPILSTVVTIARSW